MSAPVYCKTPNAAVNCQSCKFQPPLDHVTQKRDFDPRARGGNCNYFVMRLDYGVKK